MPTHARGPITTTSLKIKNTFLEYFIQPDSVGYMHGAVEQCSRRFEVAQRDRDMIIVVSPAHQQQLNSSATDTSLIRTYVFG